jgi:uncharacterized protein YcfJ
MNISTHTLLDIVVGIVTTVGIAGAVTLALMAAGTLYQRAEMRAATPRRRAVSAPHPTQTDASRDLVLR